MVTPTGLVAVEHRQVASQHATPDGPQPAQRPAWPGLLLREQRVPAPECVLAASRSPSRTVPAAARCPVTARVRAADSPSRCAACRGRRGPPARHRPRQRRPPARRTPRLPDPMSAAARSRAHRCSRCGRRARRRRRKPRRHSPCSPCRWAGPGRRRPPPTSVPARRAPRSERCSSVIVRPAGARSCSAATTAAVLAALGTRKISSSET